MRACDALSDAKSEARKAAFAQREAACRAGTGPGPYLEDVLTAHRGKPLAGYMPMRTEIDPLPAMAAVAAHGPVGVPVIRGAGQPLDFAFWTPETEMVAEEFGALIPTDPEQMVPEVLIVPLVAFTRDGTRLGYGGGFYDRTLEALRAARPTFAIGFAYAAQEAPALPMEPTDQPLDLIVTEAGIIEPCG